MPSRDLPLTVPLILANCAVSMFSFIILNRVLDANHWGWAMDHTAWSWTSHYFSYITLPSRLSWLWSWINHESSPSPLGAGQILATRTIQKERKRLPYFCQNCHLPTCFIYLNHLLFVHVSAENYGKIAWFCSRTSQDFCCTLQSTAIAVCDQNLHRLQFVSSDAWSTLENHRLIMYGHL